MDREGDRREGGLYELSIFVLESSRCRRRRESERMDKEARLVQQVMSLYVKIQERCDASPSCEMRSHVPILCIRASPRHSSFDGFLKGIAFLIVRHDTDTLGQLGTGGRRRVLEARI